MKTSELTLMSVIDTANDLLLAVDVSDTSMSPSGTSKKLKPEKLLAGVTAAHQAFSSSGQQIGTSNGSALWEGDVDRFLLFSSRLNDAAIQAIIAGGNGTSPLVRYEFSSNAGGIFADASGNGYDATITGTPTIVTA